MTTQTRKPAGAPSATGGQFTGRSHNAPTVNLDGFEPVERPTLSRDEWILQDRQARCHCGVTVDSHPGQPFFQYKGAGSREAINTCGHPVTYNGKQMKCGGHITIHQPVNPSTKRAGITDHRFQPLGEAQFDQFYCGCDGWE